MVASASRFRVEPKAPDDAWTEGDRLFENDSGLIPTLLRLFAKRVQGRGW